MFDVLNQAAQAGGQVLRKYFRQTLTISTKSNPNDIVTEADTESQEVIVNSLLSSMAKKGYKEEEVGFIGEENALARIASHTFIIDPLDGTSSFAEGRDTFAISIAYMKDKIVQAGLIYDPMRDITYFAEKGKGAYRIIGGEKEKLALVETALAESKIVYNTSSTSEITAQILNIALKLNGQVRRVREQHAVVPTLMSVVENKYQGGFNGGCKIWDIAAAKLILEEGGGQMVDWEGKEIVYDLEKASRRYQILVGDPKLIEELLSYVR